MEDQLARMDVWRPDGSVTKTEWISGHDQHYGNLVAEKKISEMDYWRGMYRAARHDEERVRDEYLCVRREHERRLYERGWVQRWLDYMESYPET